MTPTEIITYIEKEVKKANKAYALADDPRERQFYYVQEIALKDLLGKLRVKIK